MKRVWLRIAAAFAVLAAYIPCCLLLPPLIHRNAPAVSLPDGFRGERVACIDSNAEALLWRLRMIESARSEIVLSTFGFSTGSSGMDILCALHAAAERGVTVRLLLDGFHGSKTMRKSAEFQALAALPNVEVQLYNQIDLLRLWKANYRMHDKYLLVDREMYLLGGRNTNDLFLGDYNSAPNIDQDVLVIGRGSAGRLRAYFETVLAVPECRIYRGQTNEAALSALRSRYRQLIQTYPEAFGFTDWRSRTTPADTVALLTGPVDTFSKAPVLWKSLCACMAQGQQILIQTPYVICGQELYADLAALSHRRSVTILTNAPETGANPFGCADYLLHADRILATGASILEYAGENSLHTKSILIDERISIVGSFNLDMRSAYLDTEIMLLIDCPALNAQLRQQAARLAQESVLIRPDGRRTPGPAYRQGELSFRDALLLLLLGSAQQLFRHLL